MWRIFQIAEQPAEKRAEITDKKTDTIENIVSQTTEEYMLDRLSLSGCRITQDEELHKTEGRWSMYAYDIACVKWRSFDVYAPQLFWDYKVRIVWNDDKLWDYLVLENGTTWFLFWHTKTGLVRWDIVERWDRIWEINLSGMSQNYHLHFEVWKDDYNISIKKYLEWEEIKNTESTYKLRKQRGWYIWEAETMDFIADFEWFRKCSYPDWKQTSIWYGTRAKFVWECITKDEAKKRKIGHVEMVYEYVYKNVPLENHNQRKAMVSALYNLWINSEIQNIQGMNNEQIKAHFQKFVRSEMCIKKENPKWICWGLVKRRDIEYNVFTLTE